MYVEWVKVGCGGVGGPRLEGICLVGQVWASLLFQGRGNTCHDYGDVPRGPSVTSGGEEQGKVRFLACGSGRGGWAQRAGTVEGTQQAPPPASGAIRCFLSPLPSVRPSESEFSGVWSCWCVDTLTGQQYPQYSLMELHGLAGERLWSHPRAGWECWALGVPWAFRSSLGFSFRLDQPSRRRRWGAWGSLRAMVWGHPGGSW